VLAAATFGVWQSLLPALPAGIAAALPEMTDPRPVAAPTPAPAAAPLEAAPAPPVAVEAPPPHAAVSVETAPSATPPRSPAAPPPQAEPPLPARTGAASPREVCGPRTQFSLYRCMQFQCEQAGWRRHPQCVRFRSTDRVE
jgi:hypothetical protein